MEAKEAKGAEAAEEAEVLNGSQLTRKQIKKLFPELPPRPLRDPATGWMALGPAGKGKRYWYNDVTGESYRVGSAEETRNGKKYNKETDRRTYPRWAAARLRAASHPPFGIRLEEHSPQIQPWKRHKTRG